MRLSTAGVKNPLRVQLESCNSSSVVPSGCNENVAGVLRNASKYLQTCTYSMPGMQNAFLELPNTYKRNASYLFANTSIADDFFRRFISAQIELR